MSYRLHSVLTVDCFFWNYYYYCYIYSFIFLRKHLCIWSLLHRWLGTSYADQAGLRHTQRSASFCLRDWEYKCAPPCHLLQTWDFGEESVTLIKSNGGGEVGGIGGSKPGTSQRIKTNFYQLFINLPSSPGQGKKNSGKAKAKTWLWVPWRASQRVLGKSRESQGVWKCAVPLDNHPALQPLWSSIPGYSFASLLLIQYSFVKGQDANVYY